MTERQLEMRDPRALIPYDNNPKRHPPEQIQALMASIRENGWTQPIVVDEAGVILIGHGRRIAALDLGLAQVPVLVRDDLTESQKRAIRIGDNTLSAMGELDMDALRGELAALMADEDFVVSLSDLGLEGFDLGVPELESLLDAPDEARGRATQPAREPAHEEKDYSRPDLSQEKVAVGLFQIVVTAENEQEQREIYNYVREAGYDAKVLTIPA